MLIFLCVEKCFLLVIMIIGGVGMGKLGRDRVGLLEGRRVFVVEGVVRVERM